MSSPTHAHLPPPQAVVRALVNAGLSRETALAMDAPKADEVLDLLDLGVVRGGRVRSRGRLTTAW